MSPVDSVVVLDSGYVRFIEQWGSDEAFIEAARMSTAKGFLGWEQDMKLLRFLYTHQHMTPFEMGGLIVEVKAPIFVFREWHRHRVPFSYNEMSARYIPLPNENYRPSKEEIIERVLKAGANRQARGTTDKVPTNEEIDVWLYELDYEYTRAENLYHRGLGMGIPKEIARIILPVGRYSRMRCSSNVRGWLHFLELRMAKNAQAEIRVYAEAVCMLLQQRFPKTMELFLEDFHRKENT